MNTEPVCDTCGSPDITSQALIAYDWRPGTIRVIHGADNVHTCADCKDQCPIDLDGEFILRLCATVRGDRGETTA